MARANPTRAAYGDAIVDRLKQVGVPASLKEDYKSFKTQHEMFTAATAEVEKAEAAHEKKAKELAPLDTKRDLTVLQLADKMPGAGLGRRVSPFGRFSKFAPSKLVALPYAAETTEL